LEPLAVIHFEKRRPIVKTAIWSLVLRGLLCGTGSADELVFPQPLEPNRSAAVVYHFDTPATGHGFLDIEWEIMLAWVGSSAIARFAGVVATVWLCGIGSASAGDSGSDLGIQAVLDTVCTAVDTVLVVQP
jgi:hypothetical protein